VDAIDCGFGLPVRFLTYTGRRLDEALNACLCDLNLNERTLYVPDTKTGTPRARLPAAGPLFEALRAKETALPAPKARGGPPPQERRRRRSQANAGKPFLERDSRPTGGNFRRPLPPRQGRR
jgi:integrase